MQIEMLIREFSYGGMALVDPDQNLTPEQVRDVYAAAYPEITTAEVAGPEQKGDKLIYTFKRSAGTKASAVFFQQEHDGLTYIKVTPAGTPSTLTERLIGFAANRVKAGLDSLARWVDEVLFRY